MKNIKTIQDIKDLIIDIYSRKRKSSTELELSAKAVIVMVQSIQDTNIKKLMFVKACEFNGGVASTPDTLLKAILLNILFRKRATLFYVKKEEVKKLGFDGASTLTDAVRKVNQIFSPVLEIDFSEEPSHRDFLYFSFRNNIYSVSI